MIDKISTIVFLIGMLILIIVHIKLLHTEHCIIMTIVAAIAIIIIGSAWILREVRDKEQYTDYPFGYKSGKIVAGTVYSSYPHAVPGLGWVL
jgi:hypothetical protein